MKRLFAVLGIMCAAASFAAAQITITSTDVGTQFAVGTFTQPRWDSTVTSINIGSPGSTSWDFSGLKRSNVVTFTSAAVAASPYIANFPSATHALTGSIGYALPGSTTLIPATVYWYFQLSPTSLLNLGKGAANTSIQATALETSSPADMFYKLPSTLGTTWTSTYLDTTVVTLFGSPFLQAGVHHNSTYIVDAYGPLTLPGGTSRQALRIKKIDSVTAKSVGYIFLAKDGTLITVSAVDPNGPDNGTIAVFPPVEWAAPINTSAQAPEPVPEKFSLAQNYPNPFNPSTMIAYAVPVRSTVHLAVYNVLGQLVAEILNGEVEAGSHSIEWHPATASGVYLLRMDAVALDKSGATFSKVQRMAYIR